jgi:hypothetical protein
MSAIRRLYSKAHPATAWCCCRISAGYLPDIWRTCRKTAGLLLKTDLFQQDNFSTIFSLQPEQP